MCIRSEHLGQNEGGKLPFGCHCMWLRYTRIIT